VTLFQTLTLTLALTLTLTLTIRLGFSRGTLAESSYVGSEESLGPEETSRTLFLSEARLVTLAQGFTLSGSLYMRASGRSSVTASGRSSITASGRYRKVDAVIEGTVLCCTDCKGGPPFTLRLNDVAELLVNRAKLEFTLVDTTLERSSRSNGHDFRVSMGADFDRWVSGLEQWLALLTAAREAAAEERVAGRMQRIRR